MKKRPNVPMSPFVYRQEIYRDDPWKMLLACMMLNQTSYIQVDKVRHEFFTRFPGPNELMEADDLDIIEIIRPLGFYNRRAKVWKKFSKSWLEWNGNNVLDLPGVGKYASDSWKIFQEGVYNITVEDKELKKYLQWINENGYNETT
jgi:methyl-CpG-binding domain protein 4